MLLIKQILSKLPSPQTPFQVDPPNPDFWDSPFCFVKYIEKVLEICFAPPQGASVSSSLSQATTRLIPQSSPPKAAPKL